MLLFVILRSLGLDLAAYRGERERERGMLQVLASLIRHDHLC